LDAARFITDDTAVHERIVREVLLLTAEMDLAQSPPSISQQIHRRLREITAVSDPYRIPKARFNQLALEMLPELRALLESAEDPLLMAVRLSIAGNVIDMAINQGLTEADVHETVEQTLSEPFTGEMEEFRLAVSQAKDILYLADNAGEIIFDRLLVEQLSPARVTVVVRGRAVINDATLDDARTAGLEEVVEVIDNGSDAPGTILSDCSEDFQRRFQEASLIISKGQGNFETLSSEPANMFFLLKVKCPAIARCLGLPLGSHVLKRATLQNAR
jgi:uncharacterized protein with ATP-grasp and redox domains